jgi:multimeric flavodoxin WrbA
MKAVLISGSPRKDGNTQMLCQRCADGLTSEGITTEIISLAGRAIRGCTGCGWCRDQPPEVRRCIIDDDPFNGLVETIVAADIIVVGSPVYFGSATPELMALLDRIGYIARPRKLFSRKIGASIAVARRAGQNFTFAQLAYWFLINDMIMPGSSYWNVATAGAKGDVAHDEEALATIDRLAENLAWLAKKLHA